MEIWCHPKCYSLTVNTVTDLLIETCICHAHRATGFIDNCTPSTLTSVRKNNIVCRLDLTTWISIITAKLQRISRQWYRVLTYSVVRWHVYILPMFNLMNQRKSDADKKKPRTRNASCRARDARTAAAHLCYIYDTAAQNHHHLRMITPDVVRQSLGRQQAGAFPSRHACKLAAVADRERNHTLRTSVVQPVMIITAL